jgi:hypothetical protein
MDGFVSALKRLTLSTNYARWSPAFSKMVHQVSARNVAGGSRSTLTLHERIVSVVVFLASSKSYSSPEGGGGGEGSME